MKWIEIGKIYPGFKL